MVMEKRGEEMAKIGSMDLEAKCSTRKSSSLNVEPCLRVEELLKSCKLESLEGMKCGFDQWKYLSCPFSIKVGFAIDKLHIPPTEMEQMLYHLEFYNLATHTLTENEFQVVFSLAPVDYHFRQALQEHNKQCPVFFVSGFKGMIKIISFYKENKVDNECVIELMHWLQFMITRHHEIRAYFDFCADCEFNTPNKCRFWEDVSHSIKPLLSIKDENDCADAIRGYLKGLEILCKIPKSLEGLRQRRELK